MSLLAATEWLSRDPMGEGMNQPMLSMQMPGTRASQQRSLNLYSYVGNDPLGFVDPLGLWQVTFTIDVGVGFQFTFGVKSELDTPTIAPALPKKKINAETAARLRTFPKGVKLAYIQLNSQTACPPRTAVPVNQECVGGSFTLNIRIAFGHGCDHSCYVGVSQSQGGSELLGQSSGFPCGASPRRLQPQVDWQRNAIFFYYEYLDNRPAIFLPGVFRDVLDRVTVRPLIVDKVYQIVNKKTTIMCK